MKRAVRDVQPQGMLLDLKVQEQQFHSLSFCSLISLYLSKVTHPWLLVLREALLTGSEIHLSKKDKKRKKKKSAYSRETPESLMS